MTDLPARQIQSGPHGGSACRNSFAPDQVSCDIQMTIVGGFSLNPHLMETT